MSSKHIYCVYKHTSPSGKSYIGLTCDYDDRCYRHQLKSSRCRFFAFAIKKYGWDNFTHEILYDNLTEDQANYREQQTINEYGSMAPYGYNLISGGGSRSPSLETRRKISATTKGRPGRPHSPEVLLQMSIRQTGKKASAETKAKLSALRKGRPGPLSQKLAVSRRFVVTSPDGQSQEILNLNQFCKDNNLNVGNMHNVATGKAKQCKGWLCRFL